VKKKTACAAAAAAFWLFGAASAAADDLYIVNTSLYDVDIMSSKPPPADEQGLLKADVAHATWDNLVDVISYQIDCKAKTVKPVTLAHFQNMTNGLNPLPGKDSDGTAKIKTRDRVARRYVEFACGLPGSTSDFRRADGDNLHDAARAAAVDMESRLRDMMRQGDDSAAAVAGKF
jgi:hypothetical protein